MEDRDTMTRILAISGSLRQVSINTMLLEAAVKVAPQGIEVKMYNGLAEIPPFNPDIEGADFEREAPEPVKDFRSELWASDGVMIASPEYAHGVSGVIKNALDWLVGTGEFVDKPIALLNASPRATIAYDALAETIEVMGGRIVKDASPTIPIAENQFTVTTLAEDPERSEALVTALKAFERGIKMPDQGPKPVELQV
jgi:chromate reductase